MDCHQCPDLVLRQICQDLHRHCRYTGAEVCSEDLAEDYTCPLSLSIRNADQRMIAQSTLRVAQARGMLQDLLARYQPGERTGLRMLLG